jgi:hypothetical protein
MDTANGRSKLGAEVTDKEVDSFPSTVGTIDISVIMQPAIKFLSIYVYIFIALM